MDTLTFLSEIIPVQNEKLRRILEKECLTDTFRRGDAINEIGKTDSYVRFLITGTVRGYIVDHKGNETTTSFMIHPGDIIAGSRMLDGGPSEIGFIVIQDAEIFSIPVETVLKRRTQFPELMDLQMHMLAQASLYHWDCRKMLYLKTGQERYEWFLQHYPGLIDCVPHKDIASFLNISPVTLSRIRHR